MEFLKENPSHLTDNHIEKFSKNLEKDKVEKTKKTLEKIKQLENKENFNPDKILDDFFKVDLSTKNNLTLKDFAEINFYKKIINKEFTKDKIIKYLDNKIKKFEKDFETASFFQKIKIKSILFPIITAKKILEKTKEIYSSEQLLEIAKILPILWKKIVNIVETDFLFKNNYITNPDYIRLYNNNPSKLKLYWNAIFAPGTPGRNRVIPKTNFENILRTYLNTPNWIEQINSRWLADYLLKLYIQTWKNSDKTLALFIKRIGKQQFENLLNFWKKKLKLELANWTIKISNKEKLELLLEEKFNLWFKWDFKDELFALKTIYKSSKDLFYKIFTFSNFENTDNIINDINFTTKTNTWKETIKLSWGYNKILENSWKANRILVWLTKDPNKLKTLLKNKENFIKALWTKTIEKAIHDKWILYELNHNFYQRKLKNNILKIQNFNKFLEETQIKLDKDIIEKIATNLFLNNNPINAISIALKALPNDLSNEQKKKILNYLLKNINFKVNTLRQKYSKELQILQKQLQDLQKTEKNINITITYQEKLLKAKILEKQKLLVKKKELENLIKTYWNNELFKNTLKNLINKITKINEEVKKIEEKLKKLKIKNTHIKKQKEKIYSYGEQNRKLSKKLQLLNEKLTLTQKIVEQINLKKIDTSKNYKEINKQIEKQLSKNSEWKKLLENSYKIAFQLAETPKERKEVVKEILKNEYLTDIFKENILKFYKNKYQIEYKELINNLTIRQKKTIITTPITTNYEYINTKHLLEMPSTLLKDIKLSYKKENWIIKVQNLFYNSTMPESEKEIEASSLLEANLKILKQYLKIQWFIDLKEIYIKNLIDKWQIKDILGVDISKPLTLSDLKEIIKNISLKFLYRLNQIANKLNDTYLKLYTENFKTNILLNPDNFKTYQKIIDFIWNNLSKYYKYFPEYNIVENYLDLWHFIKNSNKNFKRFINKLDLELNF